MDLSKKQYQQLITYVSLLCLCAALLGSLCGLYLSPGGKLAIVRYSLYKQVERRIPCLAAAGSELDTAQQRNLEVILIEQRADPSNTHTISDFRDLRGSGRDVLLYSKFQVPKVIHQVWSGNNTARSESRSWQVDYCKRCSGWSHRLWTPADLQKLFVRSQHRQMDSHNSSVWQAEASALYEHGGIAIPIQLQWDGLRCLDSLLQLAQPTGAVVTVVNGTVPAHAVVAAVKQHPFLRQWALEAALGDMFVDNSRNATLHAALRTVDNSWDSRLCNGSYVAAGYFSSWEPALTTSLVSTAPVPSGTLFVPKQSVLQQGSKTARAAENVTCVRSSNNASFAEVTCCDLSTARAHVVASHCREDLQVFQQQFTRLLSLPAVSHFQPCLFVYSKCGQAQQVREVMPQTVHVVELDNIGREGHTYLTHIINQYDNLPGHIIFLQAGLDLFDGVIKRLESVNETSGFLSLGMWMRTALHHNELPNFKGMLVRLTELYSWVYQDLVPNVVDLTYRGQFAVAKQRVLSHPKSFYSKLLLYLTASVNHFTAKDYRFIQPPLPEPTADTQRNDPLFGHVLERSWGFVFGCGPTKDNPRAQDGLICA